MKKQKIGKLKRSEKKSRLVRTLAITQILSLFLEIFAFSFILGGMVVWSSGGARI